MSKTPTSIVVVSILGIIYGALGILATPCSVYLMYNPVVPNSMLEKLHQDSVYMVYYLVSMVVHFLLAVLLTLSSIASLKLKAWGRKGMLIYAGALIASTLFSTAMTIILLPRMEAAAAGTPSAPMMRMSGLLGAVFAVVLGGAIASVILFFFNRRIAVNAFKGIFPVSPSDFPVVFEPSEPPPDSTPL